MAGNSMKPSDRHWTRGEWACQPVMTATLTNTVVGDPQVPVASVTSPIAFTSIYTCDADGDGTPDTDGLIAYIPASAVLARFLNVDGLGSLSIKFGSISSAGAWVAKSGSLLLPAVAGAEVFFEVSGCRDAAGAFPTCVLLSSPEAGATVSFLFECTTIDGA
jgi:hypothetical protein